MASAGGAGAAVVAEMLTAAHSAFKTATTEPGHAFSVETYGTLACDIAHVTAMSVSSTLCVALLHGNQVLLVQHGSMSTAVVPLPAKATDVCWNPAGTCVVVGDATGSVHFITADAVLLFSQHIFTPKAAAGTAADAAAADDESRPRIFGAMTFASSPAGTPASAVDELLVSSVDGSILRFGNLSVQSLTDAAVSDSSDVIRAARKSISLAKLSTASLFAGGVRSAAAVHTASGKAIVVIVGGGDSAAAAFCGDASPGAALALQSVIAADAVGGAATAAHITPDGAHLFLVDDQGTLSWWALPDLALIAAWATTGIVASALVPQPEPRSLDLPALATVVRGRGGDDRLCLVRPDADSRAFVDAVSATVKLPHGTLLSAPPCRHAAAACSTPRHATGVVLLSAWTEQARVVLWDVSRAAPQHHIEKLVAAGKLDAALTWATTHSLAHAEVFQVQARLLAQALGECGDGDDAETALQRLLAALDEVEDMAFITQCCVATVVRDRKTVASLLQYVERRLIARMEELGIDEDDNDNDDGMTDHALVPLAATLQRCFAQVQDTSRRWTSYGLIAPLSSGFDAAAWHVFRKASLGAELERHLAAGQVRVSIALWRRHASPKLARRAAACLPKLPSQVPVRSFAAWLRDEIVPLLPRDDRDALATWVAARAVQVEARTGSARDALLLATVLGGDSYGVLVDHDKASGTAADSHRNHFASRLVTPAQAVRRAMSGRAAFAPLVAARIANRSVSLAAAARGNGGHGGGGTRGDQGLAAGLETPLARVCALLSSLVYLESVHGLALTLDQAQVDTAAGIGVALLDREEDPNRLGSDEAGVLGRGAIQKHVRPWCRRHGVDCDALLLTYVAELCTAIVGSDELLEDRCMAVLMCIQDPAVRVDAAMALLQAVSPPYSEQLIALVNLAVRWPSPRSAEVREQRRLMTLHGILRRYDVHNFQFDSTRQASMLLSHITAQVHLPHALHDALTIVEAYPHLHTHTAHAAFLENIATAPMTQREVATARKALAAGATADEADAVTDQAVLIAMLAARVERCSSDECLCLPQLAPADVLLAGQQALGTLFATLTQCAEAITDDGPPPVRLDAVAGFGITLPSGIGELVDGTLTAVADDAGGVAVAEAMPLVHLSPESAAKWTAASTAACAAAILRRLLVLVESVDGSGHDGAAGLFHAGAHRFGGETTAGASTSLPVDGNKVTLLIVDQQHLATMRTIATLHREFGVYLDEQQLASHHVCLQLLRGAMAPVVRHTTTAAAAAASGAGVHYAHARGRPSATGGAGAGATAATASASGAGAASDAAPAVMLSRAFRLAELMHVPREDVRAMLAQECARVGDVLASLRWCRDLSRRAASQSPDAANAATAATLREVAIALSAYTVSHPQVFHVRPHTASPAAKARARAPEYSKQLLQQAVTICSDDELAHTMSLWSGADLVTQVLAKSEVGEYGRLWEQADSETGNGATAAALLTAPATAPAEAATRGQDAGGGVHDAGDRFGADVHQDWFKETCMVLKTSRAMALVSRYAAAEQSCQEEVDAVQMAGVRLLHASPLAATPSSAPPMPSTPSSTAAPPPSAPLHLVGLIPHMPQSPGRAAATAAQAALPSTVAADAARKAARTAANAALGQLVRYLAGHNAVHIAVRVLLSAGELGEDHTGQLEELVRVLLLKVLRSKHVDTGTALGCMLTATNSAAFQTFKSVLPSVMNDYDRLLRVACVGMDAATVWSETQFLSECRTLHANARWWMLLISVGMPVDTKRFTGLGGGQHAAQVADEYRRSLLSPLLEHTQFDLAIAKRYCASFGIDPQAAVFMFVEYLLIHPAAKGFPRYQAAVRDAVRYAAAEPLSEILRNAFARCDPVDYDRLQFICSLGARVMRHETQQMERNVAALNILKTFSATPLVTAAQQPSSEDTATTDVGGASDSDIAASLHDNPLPFHDLVADPWGVLAPYINVSNLPRLVALASALELDADHFYVHIIQQIVRRHTAAHEATSSGHDEDDAATSRVMTGADTDMLRAVEGHLAHIRDPQLRVDTAQWWAGEVHSGMCKVQAYDLVANLANKWHEELLPTDAGFKLAPIASEAARDARLLRDRHRTALDVLALDGPRSELEAYLDNPRELVCQIFHKHAAPAAKLLHQRHSGLGVVTRDGMEVHRIADGIAARHKVDMMKVKRLLIQHWVFEDLAPELAPGGSANSLTASPALGMRLDAMEPSSAAGGASALTFSVFHPSPFERAQEAEAEAVLKIVYVLLPSSPSEDAGDGSGTGPTPLVISGARALLSVATMKQSSKRSYRSRARAVCAVFKLLDADSLTSLYPAGLDALASYWRYCLYMAEFEDMRVPQELSALQACSKPALARGLWRDHRHNPRAVRLIAQIMVDFGVNDANLWLAVLRQLRLFGQHRQLLALLEPLASLDCVRGSRDMAQLWQQVLMQPFEELEEARRRGIDLLAEPKAEGTEGDEEKEEAAAQDTAVEADSDSASDNGQQLRAEVLAVLEQVIVMLQRCPVLQMLDVAQFVTAFWKLGPQFFSHAVRCAFSLALPVARSTAVRRVIKQGVYVPVLDEIADSVAFAADLDATDASDDVSLVRAVFDAIDEAGKHSILTQTAYLQPFAAYLIASKRIAGLARSVMENGDFEEALQLVQHYHSTYPDCASAQAAAAAPASSSRWLPLQLFIHDIGLPGELLPDELVAVDVDQMSPAVLEAEAESPVRTIGEDEDAAVPFEVFQDDA